MTELIRRSLEEIVAGDQSRSRARSRLMEMMQAPNCKVDDSHWTREELHERTIR